jgi:hypothetical protein
MDADGRECARCTIYKPWSDYYAIPNSKAQVRGHQSWCIPCQRASVAASRDPEKRRLNARRWRETNPVRYVEGQIRNAARRRGLEPELVVAHFRSHHGACDICGGTPQDGDRRTVRLCIDHDHVTGEFRGLLCAACNIGLGKFKDDPQILAAAIEYLNQHAKLRSVS